MLHFVWIVNFLAELVEDIINMITNMSPCLDTPGNAQINPYTHNPHVCKSSQTGMKPKSRVPETFLSFLSIITDLL